MTWSLTPCLGCLTSPPPARASGAHLGLSLMQETFIHSFIMHSFMHACYRSSLHFVHWLSIESDFLWTLENGNCHSVHKHSWSTAMVPASDSSSGPGVGEAAVGMKTDAFHQACPAPGPALHTRL